MGSRFKNWPDIWRFRRFLLFLALSSLLVRGRDSSASASRSISHLLDGVHQSESISSRHLTRGHRPMLDSQDKTHLQSRQDVGPTHVTNVGVQPTALSSRSVAGNEHQNLRRAKGVFGARPKGEPSTGGGEQQEGNIPLAFIKLKTKTASIMDTVKAGAKAAATTFNAADTFTIMTSPALAGTHSPLTMEPAMAPPMDKGEATSLHGAYLILLCVGIVGVLLAVFGACFCLKRQEKHAKFMRLKPKNYVRK